MSIQGVRLYKSDGTTPIDSAAGQRLPVDIGKDPLTITVAFPTYITKVYQSTTVVYVGMAVPGSSVDSGTWQIQQILIPDTNAVAGSVSVLFADGDTSFDNTMSNYDTFSYS